MLQKVPSKKPSHSFCYPPKKSFQGGIENERIKELLEALKKELR
jgi:hypothetical protein